MPKYIVGVREVHVQEIVRELRLPTFWRLL